MSSSSDSSTGSAPSSNMSSLAFAGLTDATAAAESALEAVTEAAAGAALSFITGVPPNHTTSAVLSSAAFLVWASSTKRRAALSAASSALPANAPLANLTASASEMVLKTPSEARINSMSLSGSILYEVTSGTEETTSTGDLKSTSPKERVTDNARVTSPLPAFRITRQVSPNWATVPPACSTLFFSEGTFAAWSLESRVAKPSLFPRTARLSPALATRALIWPSSSGPYKVTVQAVLPEVAHAREGPASSLLAYCRKLCCVTRKPASKADRTVISLLASFFFCSRRHS
mmetsp:Transcript_130413/g.244002  ORF Transcript_130413/g.244002 Transcript_130413/m.244002 type:complete len:289 (+) Transcript_130413:154-1020(+)